MSTITETQTPETTPHVPNESDYQKVAIAYKNLNEVHWNYPEDVCPSSTIDRLWNILENMCLFIYGSDNCPHSDECPNSSY